MGRDPLTSRALEAPDGERRAHHVWGHVTRHTLLLRRDVALWDVAHQAVGRRLATPLHPLVDALRLERLAHQTPQMPLPRALSQLRGQVLQVFPALSLLIIAPTGGEQMQSSTVSSRGLEQSFLQVQWCQFITLFPMIETRKLIAL